MMTKIRMFFLAGLVGCATPKDTEFTFPFGGPDVTGSVVHGRWDGEARKPEILAQWTVVGELQDCADCIYAFSAEFEDASTGETFSTDVSIVESYSYELIPLVYAGTDFWGFAYDYTDYVYFSNHLIATGGSPPEGTYSYRGTFYIQQ